MKFEKAPKLFLSEVLDVVAVTVACLSSLLKLSTEPSGKSVSLHLMYKPEFSGRVSSVCRAFDCRVQGRVFDCRGQTSTQGLKITEKMKILPLPSKRVDLRLARMST